VSLSLAESKRRVALFNRIKEAENDLEHARHEYLRACGWSYTSETPGCLWLWQKTAPKPRDARSKTPAGRIMLLDTSTAFAMQRHWDDIELDESAFEEVE
jgi:hypothetical protein